MSGFGKIVEQRILDAQRRGLFDDLPGAGKPLDLDAEFKIPEDLRMAYKILKNAGCIPPELEIKREIARTENLLANMGETEKKYRVMKKLNYLITRLNLTRTGSIELDIPGVYEHRLVEKFGKKKQELLKP